jgi:hypothetical protein
MKSKRDLVIDQLALMDDIRAKANINIVTCGHCGSVILHERDLEDTITCYGCKSEMDISDCPDLFYTGIENSTIFDEEFDDVDDVLTSEISSADVIDVATRLGMNPTLGQIREVLNQFDDEADNDPTATWDLIVENILYNIIEK